MIKVFISYSHSDSDFVRRLVSDLSARLPDVSIFYDMLLTAGDSWAETLSNQIEQADVVLVVMSPEYLASKWAEQELNIAVDRQLQKEVRLIPLLLRPCTPTGFLARLVWVDFREDYEAALANLIWGMTGERPRAAEGELPGVPIEPITANEVEVLRKEVQAAVELFKSKGTEVSPVQQTNTAVGVSSAGKKQCFIVMPFGDQDLQVVYEDFVKPTLVEHCDLICERGDDVFGSNVIMEDIIKSIGNSDVVLADLTRKNANVFYEVGICHALGKPVLLLAQSMDDVPFDLRHRRVLLYEYTPRGCKRLEGKLRENMNAILSSL